jgi:hypothetical protein
MSTSCVRVLNKSAEPSLQNMARNKIYSQFVFSILFHKNVIEIAGPSARCEGIFHPFSSLSCVATTAAPFAATP